MTFTTDQLYQAILQLCHHSAENGVESVGEFVEELSNPEQWAKDLLANYVVLMTQPQ